MIERYSRKEIKNIWEDHNRYSLWLDIELAAAEAMEKFKIIPKGVVKKVKSKAKINPKRILQIEGKVKHDIIAFLTSITERVGKEGTGEKIKTGMIFTIEPMINIGKFETKTLNDGWTAVTKDKSLSAQFEHTVGVTKNGCEIFTLSKNKLLTK